jgi:hypothetical protein
MFKQHFLILGSLSSVIAPALSEAADVPKIPREPVHSSTVVSLGYDERRKLLDLEFHSGEIYRYRNVPAATARALRAAESKGRYFGAKIRGKFPFSRLQRRESGE